MTQGDEESDSDSDSDSESDSEGSDGAPSGGVPFPKQFVWGSFLLRGPGLVTRKASGLQLWSSFNELWSTLGSGSL